MVDAVDVACAIGNRRYSPRQRLPGDDDYMRRLSLPVPDKVQALGACVLRAVATNRPFAGYACVEDFRSRIRTAQRRIGSHGIVAQQRFVLVDLRITNRLSADDNVRLDDLVLKDGPQLFMLFYKPPYIGQMLVLLVVADVAAHREFPFPGA